jgi:hypothetical protein
MKTDEKSTKTDEAYRTSTANPSQFPDKPYNLHQQPKHENQLNPLNKQFATTSPSNLVN